VGVIAFAVISLGALAAVIGVIEWKQTNLAMNSGQVTSKPQTLGVTVIAPFHSLFTNVVVSGGFGFPVREVFDLTGNRKVDGSIPSLATFA
jgi:hypothetical protein